MMFLETKIIEYYRTIAPLLLVVCPCVVNCVHPGRTHLEDLEAHTKEVDLMVQNSKVSTLSLQPVPYTIKTDT